VSARARPSVIVAILALLVALWGAGFALGRSERTSSSASRAAEQRARRSAFDDAYRAVFPRGQLQGYPQGRVTGEAEGRAAGSNQVRLRAQLKRERRKLAAARRRARARRAERAIHAPPGGPPARKRPAPARRVHKRHVAHTPNPGRRRCQTRLFGEGGEGEEAEGEGEACVPAARERAPAEGLERTP
jgi:hypothetical protein